MRDINESGGQSKRGKVGATPSHAAGSAFKGLPGLGDNASMISHSPMAASEISKKF